VAGAVRRLLSDLNYNPDTHPLIGGTRSAARGLKAWKVWATS
jgi:hypothetical protein